MTRTPAGNTYLRGDVVRGSAEGLGGPVARDAFLAHSEVSDLDVAVLIEQHIIKLKIAVHNASGVEIEQPNGDLCCVKPVEWREKWYVMRGLCSAS